MISAVALLSVAILGQQSILNVSPQPTLEIGVVDGPPEYSFHQIADVRRLKDGRIAVAMPSELRIFSATGRHVTTIGRLGRGPNEYGFITSIVEDETGELHIWDASQRRLSRLSGDGAFLRSDLLDLTRFGEGGYGFERSWFTAAGKVFAFLWEINGPDPKPGVIRDPRLYALFDLASKSRIDLGNYSGSSYDPSARPTSREVFGPATLHALGRSLIALGDNALDTVQLFDSQGVRVGTIRLQRQSRSVSSRDIAAYREVILNRAGSDEGRRLELENAWRQTPKAKEFPRFGALVIDERERIWVMDYVSPADDSAAWTVFSRAGERLAELRLPRSFEPRFITDTEVMGIWTDDLEVSHIRSYRLTGK